MEGRERHDQSIMPEHVTAPPRKIVRIVTRLNIGGPAIHVALLSTRLNAQQFSTCLVVGEPDPAEGDLGSLVQDGTARVIHLKTLRRPIRPWTDGVVLRQLLRVIWQERPHIIHTHMAKAGALGRLAGLLYNRVGPGRNPAARTVLIHTFHGHVLDGYFPPRISRFFITIERWLARRTDCLIAVSQTIQDELIAKGIGCKEQWRVIPIGVDLSALSELPPPSYVPPVRVGLVGRLVPIKNPSLFLDALHRLTREGLGHSIHGVIVGDGPLREALERQSQQLGLDSVVEFTGWQRDLRSVYEHIEIACLTSWNEGTPVSLIEAMAAGRAVVATDVGGVRDLLEDAPGPVAARIAPGNFYVSQRGLLVRAGDPDGFAAALAALVSDAALRRRLGEAARSHAVRAFTDERLLRDISALYERLVTEDGCTR